MGKYLLLFSSKSTELYSDYLEVSLIYQFFQTKCEVPEFVEMSIGQNAPKDKSKITMPMLISCSTV